MAKTNSKGQLPIDVSKKYSHRLKGIYYLFGTSNVGKTTTLVRLAFLLSVMKKRSMRAKIDIYKEFMNYKDSHKVTDPKKKDAFPDIRVIVHMGYMKYAYIATHGDDIIQTEANLFFFEGRLKYDIIYILKNGKLRKLSVNEEDYYSLYPPTICLSACRTHGMMEFPLKYFADKKHNYTNVTQWIRIAKVSKKKEIKSTRRRNASYLLNNIKEILNLK